jgi:radical SAM superfamily enzyme YgiQ (UPF0313 family)
MKSAIVFNLEKKNFYSFTPLIATIDQNEELKDIDVILQNSTSVSMIKQLLKRYERIILAVSFRTAQFPQIYHKMHQIYTLLSEDELKRVIFIAGGSHPTGSPLSTLKIGFDFVFLGEGEFSLSFFLKQFLQNADLFSTPGIAYLKDKDTYCQNKNPPLIKLDDYPFFSIKRGLYPPLEITRGCSFGCAFCQVPSIYQNKIRHRSQNKLMEIIKWLANNNMGDIRFITPNSLGYMSEYLIY